MKTYSAALATIAVSVLMGSTCLAETPAVKPDITVALDGSGDFKTLQEALQSIPRDNQERKIILVKDGVYERINVDAANITIRGQSRKGTRIESLQTPLNLSNNAHDFVLENITVKNAQGVIGVHAFAIQGRADRTVLIDSEILSHGNDTIALWRQTGSAGTTTDPTILKDSGRYYHARINVTGSVDFICPRGWCYMVDSTMTEMNPGAEASMWHDGNGDPDKKFVMRGCKFDGPENFYLARHHHDAHFYFIDCTFSKVMRDTAAYRVIYPLNGGPATPADVRNNEDHDKTNIYGERAYYFNSHREGANDYVWHRNNLSSAPGGPKADQITAKWTFAGTWDPENKVGPKITQIAWTNGKAQVKFDEPVTVKGKPGLKLANGELAPYASGSGSDTLMFSTANSRDGEAASLEMNGGAIIASRATATLRMAEPALPRK